MLQYMLDTDTCIYAGKSHPPNLLERFNLATGLISISTITLAELYFGVEKSTRRAENLETLERLVGRLDVLPFSSEAASDYGALRLDLQRSGKLVGPHDMLIAAHARSEGLILVTNNIREFRRIPGLRVENWV
ncbi:MAG: type II toxin-antitoxin system tRNA(fMet)-specific endonuclease VapC [Rhizomicrobium sp.]